MVSVLVMFCVRLVLSSTLVSAPAMFFFPIFKPNGKDDLTRLHSRESYSNRTVGALYSQLVHSLSLQRATIMCVDILKSGNMQFVRISSRSVVMSLSLFSVVNIRLRADIVDRSIVQD